MLDQILITREKHYPTPGTNYRASWTWIYTVHADPSVSAPDGQHKGRGLRWAKRLAATKANGRPVRMAWTATT
jgi:hypothetical protein